MWGAFEWLGLIQWLTFSGLAFAFLLVGVPSRNAKKRFGGECSPKTGESKPPVHVACFLPFWAQMAGWTIGYALVAAASYLIWALDLNHSEITSTTSTIIPVIYEFVSKETIYNVAISFHIATLFIAMTWMKAFWWSFENYGWLGVVIISITLPCTIVTVSLFYCLLWYAGLLYTLFMVWVLYVFGWNIAYYREARGAPSKGRKQVSGNV